jgi:hypothetical protein
MSATAPTFIVAQIHVTSGGATPTVTCTSKVRSGLGIVIWFVHNDCDDDLNSVKLINFRRVTASADLKILSGSFPDLDTGPIASGHKSVLPGVFLGTPGDVYEYDVQVNGHLAADPQLEI